MKIEQRLKELNIELPGAPAPIANYVRYVQVGNLLFVSGHGPSGDGKMVYTGKVGAGGSLEEGYQAARLVMLNRLAGGAPESCTRGDRDGRGAGQAAGPRG